MGEVESHDPLGSEETRRKNRSIQVNIILPYFFFFVVLYIKKSVKILYMLNSFTITWSAAILKEADLFEYYSFRHKSREVWNYTFSVTASGLWF